VLRWLLLSVVTLVLWASNAPATLAQDPNLAVREDEFAAAVNDPMIINTDERVSVVLAIHNETTVNGTIRDIIMVIDGTVTINGAVTGDIVAFSSHIVLGPNATVNNIDLNNSTIDAAPGSIVSGTIENRSNFFLLQWWSSPVFALILWVLTTMFLIIGGVIFTLAAGQQFPAFVSATSRSIGKNILYALIVWLGVPVVALLVMVTIIGIPLGMVVLGILLPGLWWLGYTAVGARIGSLILRPFTTRHSTALAVLSTMIGVLLLQLLTLLPYVGGMAIFFSGAYGAGAMVYHFMRRRHDRQMDPELAAFGPEFSRASADLRFRNE
jgi:hypothetical protein